MAKIDQDISACIIICERRRVNAQTDTFRMDTLIQTLMDIAKYAAGNPGIFRTRNYSQMQCYARTNLRHLFGYNQILQKFILWTA